MGDKIKKVNKLYEELRDNCSYPLLFFLPKSYFEEFLEPDQMEVLHWMFDELILAIKKGDVVLIEDIDRTQEMLKKRSALNENLFNLVNYKTELKPAQFSVLKQKYKEHLFAMHTIAKLLLKEVEEGLDERYKKYKPYFILQEDAYNEHQKEIDDTFKVKSEVKKEKIDLRAFVSNNFTVLKKEINSIEKETIKKKSIITDLEARNFLLESVFKISLEKMK